MLSAALPGGHLGCGWVGLSTAAILGGAGAGDRHDECGGQRGGAAMMSVAGRSPAQPRPCLTAVRPEAAPEGAITGRAGDRGGSCPCPGAQLWAGGCGWTAGCEASIPPPRHAPRRGVTGHSRSTSTRSLPPQPGSARRRAVTSGSGRTELPSRPACSPSSSAPAGRRWKRLDRAIAVLMTSAELSYPPPPRGCSRSQLRAGHTGSGPGTAPAPCHRRGAGIQEAPNPLGSRDLPPALPFLPSP